MTFMTRARYSTIIGIDEAGRGPIAGPVMVGLCTYIKKHEDRIERELDTIYVLRKDNGSLRDSKQLSEPRREELYAKLLELHREGLLEIRSASSSAKVIDRVGITRAIAKAIARVIRPFTPSKKTHVYLDGSLRVHPDYSQETLIKGDTKELSICLASIVAKVRRDRIMNRIARSFPEYGFDQHKGYGTKKHMLATEKHGKTIFHRFTFLRKNESR